jgi:shikimate kinase
MKTYPERIFICGFMGAGKTTAAWLLANRIRHRFIDLDSYIEKKEHKTVSGIFSKFDEKYFRNLEQQYLRELSSWNRVVVALGGGTLADTEVVEFVKRSGILVYINIDLQTIITRVKRNRKRPLLLDKHGSMKPDEILEDELSELMERRRPLYEMAHIIVTRSKDDAAEEMVDEIIKKIEDFDTPYQY